MNEHSQKIFERWQTFPLAEQLGNIGSEIARVRHWQEKDKQLFLHSAERALELFDFTLEDPRWRSSTKQDGRLREIARAREVFCDALSGGKSYDSSLDDLCHYFLFFAYTARRDKNKSA